MATTIINIYPEPTTDFVEVYPDENRVVTLEVGFSGPQGDQGPAGADGSVSTSYTFPTATTQWTVNHNLGHDPAVAVIVGSEQVVTDVVHATDHLTTYVNFGTPASGVAVLS